MIPKWDCFLTINRVVKNKIFFISLLFYLFSFLRYRLVFKMYRKKIRVTGKTKQLLMQTAFFIYSFVEVIHKIIRDFICGFIKNSKFFMF